MSILVRLRVISSELKVIGMLGITEIIVILLIPTEINNLAQHTYINCHFDGGQSYSEVRIYTPPLEY